MATDINDTVTQPLPIETQVPPIETPVVAVAYQTPPIPDAVDPLLQTILSWPRAHDTDTERAFNGWLRARLAGIGVDELMTSAYDTIIASVNDSNGKESDVLFACHVDTCDSQQAKLPVSARKSVCYDPTFGQIFLDKTSPIGECLGADDGVGVWILLKMIESKVPGVYVFNRGEERGGLGSTAMANLKADWLRKFSVCVEFDRPRNDEVITHQRGGARCASDKFAVAMCKALNDADRSFAYRPSAAGVFTDNFNWRGLIAECVNVGVGYTDQHGKSEVLDYAHAYALMRASLKVDWMSLPIDRTPEVTSGTYYGRSWGGAGRGLWVDRELPDWDDMFDRAGGHGRHVPPDRNPPSNVTPMPQRSGKKKKKVGRPNQESLMPAIENEILMLSKEELTEWLFTMDGDDAVVAMLIELAAECRGLRAKNKALMKYIAS